MPRRKKQVPLPSGGTARNDRIIVRGARVHNLKNVDLDLPRNRLIVFTGVSGSGKSSLAFDTIYAEGQRRYVESLSSYARQFLERMEKPDVDLIQGIGPAIAIEQRTGVRNPRSTVATTTEIYDHLRLLYARIGRTICRNCGKPVARDSVQTVFQSLASELDRKGGTPEGLQEMKVYITFPLPVHPKESLGDAVASIRKEGFFRLLAKGEVVDLNEATLPLKSRAADISVLVDRLVYRPGEESPRLADSLETAFASGGGRAQVVLADSMRTLQFDRNFNCSSCGISYEEPEPRLFSFNSPYGACPECQGFGSAIGIDMDLVVPDPSRSLRDGAVQPWTTPKFADLHQKLIRAAAKANLRADVPYKDLSDEERDMVINGFDGFEGVAGFFRWVEKKAYKIFYRVLLSRYRGYTTCSSCGGSRLRREALNVRVSGKRISDVIVMTVAEARRFFRDLQLTQIEQEVARKILEEVRKRLAYLDDVGLGYLTLDRLSSTLSGGESQRINLATSLGSALVGALYVLDEPSIGLHPRDNQRLINLLKSLRDIGNTVLVVEHDAGMIRAADMIVDLGPGAGTAGGSVVFAGSPGEILQNDSSLTGRYLSGKVSIPMPADRRSINSSHITIRGAAEHNLKGIDVVIPLHVLVCVTGVSGSGKSTLVYNILYEGLRRRKGDFSGKQSAFGSLEGDEAIDAVECVDQSPIGRSPRSNPITYIQVFDHVRQLFSRTPAAKIHGFGPGHFSFNVPGGRCESCEGDGVVRVEMQFMADLYLPCDDCKGRRYQKEVLGVRWNGKNIDDVLNLTVSDAISFFGSKAEGRKVAQRLKVLDEVGLGYIHLGQPATSLSGGEAQRIKLAAHLTGSDKGGRTLFLFDEPTTGLHFDDVARLMKCFNALVNAGNSVVIIEHNLDVIKGCDHVIDLGPEAGDQGGRIVAQGTPEAVALVPDSHTGRFLREVL